MSSILQQRSSPYAGKRLTTLKEVDEALRLAADARRISERKFLEQLGSFWLNFPPVSGDPWSLKYRKHWWSAYEHLAGRSYDIKNEDFDFDVEFYVTHPYPFCTQDYHVVSQQLIDIGSIILALVLPHKSTILEMGAGWGIHFIPYADGI